MRPTFLALTLVTAVAGGWFGRRAFGEDAPAAPAMPSEAEMEKIMTALGTPGEMHTWLAETDGSWSLATKAYKEGGTVVESTGTAEMRMVLGGRFQEQVFRGTFDGKPFEGRGLTGYDNLKKEFVNTWFDSMSTAPSVAKGQRSADGKSLTLSGTWDLPGMAMPFRYVIATKSAKEFTFSIIGTMGGRDVPIMDATYTRK